MTRSLIGTPRIGMPRKGKPLIGSPALGSGTLGTPVPSGGNGSLNFSDGDASGLIVLFEDI